MKSTLTVQVARWLDDSHEYLEDVKEIVSACAVDELACAVSEDYVMLEGTYEVMSFTDHTDTCVRRLCWDIPEGEETERLCVIVDDAVVDFRTYCGLLFRCSC